MSWRCSVFSEAALLLSATWWQCVCAGRILPSLVTWKCTALLLKGQEALRKCVWPKGRDEDRDTLLQESQSKPKAAVNSRSCGSALSYVSLLQQRCRSILTFKLLIQSGGFEPWSLGSDNESSLQRQKGSKNYWDLLLVAPKAGENHLNINC